MHTSWYYEYAYNEFLLYAYAYYVVYSSSTLCIYILCILL